MIPIVVGVTGHRDLREKDVPALRAGIRAELEKLMALCPHSEFVMLNSIASGADTLCAQEGLKLGFRLVCPLPMPADAYRKDFAAPDAAAFDALLERAERVFEAPGAGDAPAGDADARRHFGYGAAGRYVAGHSHVLLALWDGSPARPEGCGTAETVACAVSGGREAAGGAAVIHVQTPRSRPQAATLPVSVRLLEREEGALARILSQLDALNAEEDKAPGGARRPASLLPEETPEPADARRKSIRGSTVPPPESPAAHEDRGKAAGS